MNSIKHNQSSLKKNGMQISIFLQLLSKEEIFEFFSIKMKDKESKITDFLFDEYYLLIYTDNGVGCNIEQIEKNVKRQVQENTGLHDILNCIALHNGKGHVAGSTVDFEKGFFGYSCWMYIPKLKNINKRGEK